MSRGGFSGRRKELEESFFGEQDRKLLAAIREKEASRERKKALGEASGICDDALLDQLHELDLCSETLVALSLVPLIAVAWADGNVDVKERQAVLTAAEQKGVEADHPAHKFLECWLEKQPDPHLMETWKAYVSTLLESLDADARSALKEDLLGRARAVAEAAGGLMGLGKRVSKVEQAVLNDLEEVFG
jgi:hypothetical protein